MNRRRAVVLVVVVLAGAGGVSLRARQGALPPVQTEQAPPERKLPVPVPLPDDWQVFRDWIAVGSGCYATSSMPGDVTLNRITIQQGGKEIHRARFHIGGLRLTEADRPADQQAPRFGRECAIRVQLASPPGKRLAKVTAHTQVISTKSPGVRLMLSGQLRIGSTPIGHQLVIHEGTESIRDALNVFEVSPGTPPEEPLPPLVCAEPRLLGFDLTWIAEPTGEDGKLSVSLGGGKVLDLDVEFSDCG